MSELKICSWNIQHNPDAWTRLAQIRDELGIQVAFLQEATPPASGNWTTHPDVSASDEWMITAHADVERAWSSVVVLLDESLKRQWTPVRPQPLGAAAYGKFAVSHPGQFAVAEVVLPAGQRVTLVSLYGVWDGDERYIFAEATLHRAISDLTVLLQERGRDNVVLAGDLNIYRDWEHADRGASWAPRYSTVFDRLAAYGLTLVGPYGEKPLERCPCRRPDCDHVRTYAHNRNPRNVPYQLDYVFASQNLVVDAQCLALEDEAAWKFSDHLPVVSTLTIE